MTDIRRTCGRARVVSQLREPTQTSIQPANLRTHASRQPYDRKNDAQRQEPLRGEMRRSAPCDAQCFPDARACGRRTPSRCSQPLQQKTPTGGRRNRQGRFRRRRNRRGRTGHGSFFCGDAASCSGSSDPQLLAAAKKRKRRPQRFAYVRFRMCLSAAPLSPPPYSLYFSWRRAAPHEREK